MAAQIEDLEKQTKKFSEANDDLTDLKREMSSEFETIRAKYIKKIKAAVENVISAKSELSEMILDSESLFIKPKTMTMNGVMIGFRKSKDVIEFDDENKVIELIEKNFNLDQQEDLLKVQKKVLKAGIMRLPLPDIKKIKCRMILGSEGVLITTIDTEIDKFVTSLMKESDAE